MSLIKEANGMDEPTVVITGASIGIGAATARAFATAGYRVIVTDILEEEGQSVVAGIESNGGAAEYHRLDVTKTEEVEAVVSSVQDRYGPIDTVVGNAGIAYRVPLDELDDERWDHTLEDRKSTRLNSSHANISYAVFCLKKKKIDT